jgi:predicted MFS family arabinose efflux permease
MLPDMTEYTLQKYHKSTHEKVNNMTSGIFNTAINLGNAFGAFIGAVLNEKIGFRYTADVIGISIFIVGVIYYFTTNSAKAFR